MATPLPPPNSEHQHNNRRPYADRPHAAPPEASRVLASGDSARRPRPRPRRRRRPAGPASLHAVATAFNSLTRGPAPLSLDGAAVRCGLPRRPIPLDELRTILLRSSSGRVCRDAAWRRLVLNARGEGPAWVVGAAGVALPALRKMTAELSEGYRGDRGEVGSAVLAGFVEALTRIDVDRPGVITRLRWAAYRAGLKVRYREGIPSMPLPPLESAPPPAPWGHPDLILLDALTKGVLSPVQVELIGRTRLEDRPMKQVAAELGIGYEAACKARQRGEARLTAAMCSGDVEHRLSAPALTSGLTRVGGNKPAPGGEPDVESSPEPGVRGQSTTSDGTSEPDGSPNPTEGGFCGPARHPTSPGLTAGASAARRRSGRRQTRRARPSQGSS